jgi:hypothetical protein
MLIDRLPDDRLDPAVETFRAWDMAGGQELGDGVAANTHLSQERPYAARCPTERFGDPP